MLGNFNDKYKNIGEMITAMEPSKSTAPVTVGEFQACRTRTVELLKEGVLTLKNRGSKKTKVMGELGQIRKTIVTKYKEAGRVNKSEFDVSD